MSRVLVFDIWGDYGHFKKIYATTSALTYPVPFKTTIYGLVGAITGLEKTDNIYLEHFKEGMCKIGIELLSVPKTQRLHTNLSPAPGLIKSNRKPTLIELVKQPYYRIYWTHQDAAFYEQLKEHLAAHTTVYTPSLGLANLLANFKYLGEYAYKELPEGVHELNGLVPGSAIRQLDPEGIMEQGNEIMEIAMYALEMDRERNVTKRDTMLFDRKQKSIRLEANAVVELEAYLKDDFKILLF